jgi:ribose 1,5-bisphosphokinase
MTGRLFVVIGPSGVGKDTLLAGVCDTDGPYWVRRVITRPAILGGEPYEAVTEDDFARRLSAGEFALHWRAHGLQYAVPHAELAQRAAGQDVVFNGSRAALGAALAAFPDLTIIHVTAPASVLAARLAARGRESAPDIAARLARDVSDWPDGAHVIKVANDADPATGIARLRAAIQTAPVSGTRRS